MEGASASVRENAPKGRGSETQGEWRDGLLASSKPEQAEGGCGPSGGHVVGGGAGSSA